MRAASRPASATRRPASSSWACWGPSTSSGSISRALAWCRGTRPVPTSTACPRANRAFLACTFWLADNLALKGKRAEPRALFERLLDIRNDVGLLSEQYDPHERRLVGNFPQAFSHVGLINTARNLSRRGGPAEHRKEG